MRVPFLAFALALVVAASVYHRPILDFLFKRIHGGLLTSDFDIVSIEDLKYADEGALFSRPRNNAYPYWQCFRKDQLSASCDFSEPRDKLGSSLVLEIDSSSVLHSYYTHNSISGEVCEDLLAEITAILKNQVYFCVNGNHPLENSVRNKKEYSWNFHRMKTKVGYAHYLREAGHPYTE